MNAWIIEGSMTLFFANTQMSQSVGFVTIEEVTMAPTESTSAYKNFVETFKSPLECLSKRVMKPRRRSIVDKVTLWVDAGDAGHEWYVRIVLIPAWENVIEMHMDVLLSGTYERSRVLQRLHISPICFAFFIMLKTGICIHRECDRHTSFICREIAPIRLHPNPIHLEKKDRRRATIFRLGKYILAWQHFRGNPI